MDKLKNRVFIVSGAASGMGRSIVEAFINEGAKVIGVSLESNSGYEHSNYKYYSSDITDYNCCLSIVNSTIKTFNKLDGLVNCVGITNEGNLETMECDLFKRTFQINVFGIFSMCKAAISELKKHNSTIVNISSNMAVKPLKDRIAYNPSKAAVNMLTQCISLDYAQIGRASCWERV